MLESHILALGSLTLSGRLALSTFASSLLLSKMDQINRFVTDPKYHDVLAIVKGASQLRLNRLQL